MDVFCNVVQAILDCKVAGFQAMHLCLGQIFEVSFSAFAGEKNVVLPPEDDRVGLSFS